MDKIKQNANSGDKNAMHEYAIILIAQNDSVAGARLFEQAALNGHELAAYNTGVIYKLGLGVTADMNKAKKYLRISYDAGCRQAGGDLSMILMQEKKNRSAFRILKKLAVGRLEFSKEAKYYLGALYYNGEGVKINKRLGMQYLMRSALMGDPDAQSLLADFMLSAKIPRPREAALWYAKSARHNHENLPLVHELSEELGFDPLKYEGPQKRLASNSVH